MNRNILNIGILAHVDAGKTTLTEQILYLTGAVKTLGSVDKKTSNSDTLNVEKNRGISVNSSILTTNYNTTKINIIDTPGHVDFSGEVERALKAVDCALLIVSAVEGIQAQTEVLSNALIKCNIPFAIFINKIDRAGSNVKKIVKELNNLLKKNIILLSNIENEGSKEANSLFLFTENKINNNILESICEIDDFLLGRYLEGEIPNFNILKNVLKREVLSCNLIPVIAGSSMNSIGIKDLIDFLTLYFSKSFKTTDNSPSFQVVNVQYSDKEGKKVFVRLKNGVLKVRDSFEIKGNVEKITKLKKIDGSKETDTEKIENGDVGIVFGLNSLNSGDIFGNIPNFENFSLSKSTLSVEIIPENMDDFSKLTDALFILNEEDPFLNFNFDKIEKILTINIRGIIQIEILKQILIERFEIPTTFSPPTIIYKETIENDGFGYAEYTMPKPCWAIVKFHLEPLGTGEGIVYQSTVSKDKIQNKYQNEVELTINKALKQGPLGWEVTDLKITLTDGEDHNVHSNPGDFKIATPMGIMDGLMNCKTTLLEPISKFKISAPADFASKLINDLTEMRAIFNQPEIVNDKINIDGEIPIATSYEYGIKLSSTTKGKGIFSTTFSHYAKCDKENGVVRPYKGINPLDKSKYILHMRNAIK